MNPVKFPEANKCFTAPPGYEESQVMTIDAYVGKAEGGSCDGALVVVVAWQPSPEEIQAMQNGAPIFLSCIGGLPAHFLTTSFHAATHPL